ncbi:MAG: DUF4860 domain-containing protein [Oscillospiraceae bacterium]|nr:DUF4860 domain-containing protein [Oscillospiraceae bacterium]
MKQHNNQRSVGALAALLLLGVFAVSILSVLLAGTGTYQRLTRRDQSAHDSRTCAQYLAAKVRQAYAPHEVCVQSFDGSDALVTRREVDGQDYLERVYCYDGWLMELFAPADSDMDARDGEKIMQADSMTLRHTQSRLWADVTQNGQTTQLILHLPGGEEAAQ